LLFNSLTFLWFFLIVYSLYVILDHRWQNRMLLAASLLFYGWWDWRFLSLLFVSILLDFYTGIKIHESATLTRRRWWLAASMTGNLTMLCFFKYFNFFTQSFADLMALFGLTIHPVMLQVILPVGISFYTFQTMSYTIDIYRRQMAPTRSLLNFSLFVSFFPQLVAGPIERAKNLLPQCERPRTLNLPQIKEGCFLVAWGLFQKVIIADHVAPIVNTVMADYANRPAWDILLGFYAFYFQLYCDFSGYSDTARGLAKMMGFELMINFRNPICAQRLSDFWTRWHISLTTFVRDYLFVSLGGVHRGNFRMNLNLLLTMTVIGLWHGARWTYILWGVYFGVLQVAYNLIRPLLRKIPEPTSSFGRSFQTVFNIVLTAHVVLGSLVFFRPTSLAHIGGLLGALGNGFFVTPDVIHHFTTLVFFASPLLIMEIWQFRTDDLLIFTKQKSWVRFAGYLAAILMVLYVYLFTANLQGGEEFIYFQF
jgi:D-alanyl-lipoteichoic acid acyltransferase DltB (MBOAT superfamily)